MIDCPLRRHDDRRWGGDITRSCAASQEPQEDDVTESVMSADVWAPIVKLDLHFDPKSLEMTASRPKPGIYKQRSRVQDRPMHPPQKCYSFSQLFNYTSCKLDFQTCRSKSPSERPLEDWISNLNTVCPDLTASKCAEYWKFDSLIRYFLILILTSHCAKLPV